MNYRFGSKFLFICLLISATFGCQNQTVSNSANNTNSNVPVKNTNITNQSNPDARVPPPKTVRFESSDKVEIVGTFYQSPKANFPAVLLLHQWESNRKSYNKFAQRLQMQYFNVLAIDGRGFGESVKTLDGKTVATERSDEAVKGMKADVERAFDFLAKQKNVDNSKIGIVGASYGSSLAIIYAAENKQVKAVVLLSPGLNYFGNMPTLPAIKNYGNRSILLVAAEDDKDSAESVRQLKAANENSETQIYKSGGHGTALFKAKIGLEDLLETFLTKNL